MLLDDVLEDLRHVENGGRLMDKPLAGRAADTMEMLLEINRCQEEQLAYFKELQAEGRLKILAPLGGERCETCQNYNPFEGKLCGRCMVRMRTNKRGEKVGGPLFVTRSKKGCRDYRKKEEK